MLRCLNCRLCLDRRARHSVSSLQSPMQTLLAKWKSLQQLSQEAVICQECFLRLNQHCEDRNVNAERELGHMHVCLGCGRSVSEIRRRLRHHSLELNDPIVTTIMSWDVYNEVMSRLALVCHTCWIRASRQRSHDFIRKRPDEIKQELIPVPPSPPPPQEQQVKKETVEPVIVLPHYKRLANTSRHCAFQGCTNNSGHLIPPLIKVLLLKEYHLYVPRHSRICKIHLFGNDWALLNNNANITNSFTANQIEDLIRNMEKKWKLNGFRNCT